jgi:hypothetical protein
MRIWRVGCIIQCNHIADMLEPILASSSRAESSHKIMNMKLISEVSDALHRNFTPLKQIVSKYVQWDVDVATLSASLEYLKYGGGIMLPTKFMEAEMDIFGSHNYDRPGVRGGDPARPKKGCSSLRVEAGLKGQKSWKHTDDGIDKPISSLIGVWELLYNYTKPNVFEKINVIFLNV